MLRDSSFPLNKHSGLIYPQVKYSGTIYPESTHSGQIYLENEHTGSICSKNNLYPDNISVRFKVNKHERIKGIVHANIL